MTTYVIELDEYKKQVLNVVNDVQRKAISTLLQKDPFFGTEVPVGNMSFMEFVWDESSDIKITYSISLEEDKTEVYLISITGKDVKIVSNASPQTNSFLKSVAVGVSSKIIADNLINAIKDMGDWFDL